MDSWVRLHDRGSRGTKQLSHRLLRDLSQNNNENSSGWRHTKRSSSNPWFSACRWPHGPHPAPSSCTIPTSFPSSQDEIHHGLTMGNYTPRANASLHVTVLDYDSFSIKGPPHGRSELIHWTVTKSSISANKPRPLYSCRAGFTSQNSMPCLISH